MNTWHSIAAEHPGSTYHTIFNSQLPAAAAAATASFHRIFNTQAYTAMLHTYDPAHFLPHRSYATFGPTASSTTTTTHLPVYQMIGDLARLSLLRTLTAMDAPDD